MERTQVSPLVMPRSDHAPGSKVCDDDVVVRGVGRSTPPHTASPLAAQGSLVESTGALVGWSIGRPTARDSCSLPEQGHVAPSYPTGCAAAGEHSWGVWDRRSARGTLSGRRERETGSGASVARSAVNATAVVRRMRQSYVLDYVLAIRRWLQVAPHLSIRQSIPLVCIVPCARCLL